MMWLNQAPVDWRGEVSLWFNIELVSPWRSSGVPRFIAAAELACDEYFHPVDPTDIASHRNCGNFDDVRPDRWFVTNLGNRERNLATVQLDNVDEVYEKRVSRRSTHRRTRTTGRSMCSWRRYCFTVDEPVRLDDVD